MTSITALPVQYQNVKTCFQPVNFIDVTVHEVSSDVVVEEKDSLIFMAPFQAQPLSAIRASMMRSNYKPEVIEEIISGLATLPEYRD